MAVAVTATRPTWLLLASAVGLTCAGAWQLASVGGLLLAAGLHALTALAVWAPTPTEEAPPLTPPPRRPAAAGPARTGRTTRLLREYLALQRRRNAGVRLGSESPAPAKPIHQIPPPRRGTTPSHRPTWTRS